jgi:hypothetical protein
MAMGKRTSKQAPMFVAATELLVSPGHPFYAKLNTILDGAGFDRFAEEQCQRFYAPVIGTTKPAARSLLPPGGEALARACAPGAIAASRPGAQPSLPTAAELEEILAR